MHIQAAHGGTLSVEQERVSLKDVTETPLAAPLNVGFDYTRSTGPVLGRFVTALREHRIEGIRGSDGRVHVPPVEYDPVTAEQLSEFVPVADEATVVSWSVCAG